MTRPMFVLLMILALFHPGATFADLTIGEEHNGKDVSLALGGKTHLTVQLEGNPTTGFTWELGKLEGKAIVADGAIEYRQGKTGAIGAGGLFLARFKAVQAGKAKLTLIYHRVFEKGVPPARTFTVSVTVAGARK